MHFLKRYWIRITIGLLLLISAAGASYWSWRLQERAFQKYHLQQATLIAQAVDPDAIGELAGEPSDVGRPRYQQLKKQFIAVRGILPDVRFIYLMAQREDGRMYFLVDSETPGSPDESLPGQEYLSIDEFLRNAFSKGAASVSGPVADEWGTWISALAPLTDPNTGKTIAVLGVDIDAHDWRTKLTRASMTPFLLSAALAILVFCFMVILGIRDRIPDAEQKSLWSRRIYLVFTGLFGLNIIVLATWFGSWLDQSSRKDTFERLANTQVRSIEARLKDLEYSDLEGVNQFYRASQQVSRDEFEQYATSLVENPLVSYWTWTPHITRGERNITELLARQEGLADFSITEKDATGALVPASERDSYDPILYIAPHDPQNPVLGMDLSSEYLLSSAMAEARQTGLVTATDLVNYTKSEAASVGLVVIKPIASRNDPGQVDGFVTASIPAARLTRLISNQTLTGENPIYIDFYQLFPDQAPFLFVSTGPVELQQRYAQNNLVQYSEADFSYIFPIIRYGKAYLAAAHPSPAFDQLYPSRIAHSTASLGSLLTLFVLAMINFYSSHNVVLSRLVKQRTQDLENEIDVRKHTEEKLSLLLKREESIVAFGQALADKLDYQVISDTASAYLTPLFDLRYLVISVVDEKKKTITVKYLRHQGQPLDASQVEIVDYSPDACNCLRVRAATQRAVLTANGPAARDARNLNFLPAGDDRIQSVIIAPMLVEDEITGLLELYSAQENAFDAHEIESMTIIANLIGLSLQNTRLYMQARKRSENLLALHTIDLTITSGADLQTMAGTLLKQVVEQLKVDAACFLLPDKTTQEMRFFQGYGFKTGQGAGENFSLAALYAETIAGERRDLFVPDLSLASPPSDPGGERQEGFVSLYGVPLIAKGQIKGVLEVFQRSPLTPDPEWMEFVKILAGQSAIAIDTAETFADLQLSNLQLTRAYDSAIQGWSQALDLRDKETEGHTLRVTEMAVKFGEALGLPENEILKIRWGALLHDIGKIGVPDDILLKPGKLTDEEWVIMRRHPETARALLSNIEYLQSAIDIPYCHHERWDGNGYPRRLKGKDIPLAARMFSIIDVWDALSSDRPYRPAWSADRVIAYIKENSGSAFEPELVTIFLNLVQGSQDETDHVGVEA